LLLLFYVALLLLDAFVRHLIILT